MVILARTELLERKLFLGSDRFYVYANRAEAYWFQGDEQHALGKNASLTLPLDERPIDVLAISL